MLRVVSRVLLIASFFLLLSFGGAIFAAPVTLPALVYMWRTDTRGWRIASAISFALTIAEVSWALVYVGAGEDTPAIWVVPAFAVLVTLIVGVRRGLGASRAERLPAS